MFRIHPLTRNIEFIGFVGEVDPLVAEQFHEANLHVVELKKLSFFPIVENKKHLLVFDFKKQSVQKGEIDLFKTLLKEKVALLFLHHAENDAVINILFVEYICYKPIFDNLHRVYSRECL